MGFKRYLVPFALAASVSGDVPREPVTPHPVLSAEAGKFSTDFHVAHEMRGQGLDDALTRMANGNVMILNVDAAKPMTREQWAAHPLVRAALPVQSDRLLMYGDMTQAMAAAREGNAFTTRLKGPGATAPLCAITIGAGADHEALLLAGLSLLPVEDVRAFLTAQFDWNSLRTFILLHEAAHCSQGQTESDLVMNILRNEIDADNKALVAYRALAAENPALDARLPDKIRQLRALGGLLAPPVSEDPVLSILSHYYHTHTTALGLHDNVTPDDRGDEATARVFDVNAYTKSASALLTYHASEPAAMDSIEADWIKVLANYPWPEDNPQIAQMMVDLPLGAQIGALQQMMEPGEAYFAMRYLAEEGLVSLNPSQRSAMDDVRTGARSFVAAWQYFNLPRLDTEYAVYKSFVETRFGMRGPLVVEALLLDYHEIPLPRAWQDRAPTAP